MKLFVFAVKDRATDMFGTPMFLVSAGQATRSFTDEVNRPDKENQLYSHPGDFDLYTFGAWESDTGKFGLLEVPQLVVRGQDVRVKQ